MSKCVSKFNYPKRHLLSFSFIIIGIYPFLSEHVIELSLSRQSRLDPDTSIRYNEELGTYLFGNFGLIELREYCMEFIQKYLQYCADNSIQSVYIKKE